MSSIIDALKKSDNNRNTEDSSSVNQIKFSDDKPPKSRKGFWLLIIFLLFIAGGVFAWQQGWHHPVIAKAKSLLGSNEPAPQNNPARPKTDQPKPDLGLEKTPDNNKNKLVPPKTNDIKDRSAAVKKRIQSETEEVTKQDQGITEARSNKRDDNDSNSTEINTDEIVAVERKKDNPTSTKEETENKKTLDPELKQDHLLVHQIPFELRKNIPPIKLNIHIYDPEPENRMVLLNGVKYSVGDLIEELVEVKDITKEGVVLKFETVEFLVPK